MSTGYPPPTKHVGETVALEMMEFVGSMGRFALRSPNTVVAIVDYVKRVVAAKIAAIRAGV